MDAVLNISPGLIIWTLVSFGVFFFMLLKFGYGPLRESLEAREHGIADAIANAEKANVESQRLLAEAQAKLSGAQHEMMEIVKNGKISAEEIVRKAGEEAEKVKQQKIEETLREITREKDAAVAQLRTEVASLVVQATEKVLDAKLDASAHKDLIEKSISQVAKG